MPSPFPSLPPDQRGTVHCEHHHSTALAGNPWADPVDRDCFVYTPPAYDPHRIYPALLVLAPYSGTGESQLARGLTDISFATRADRLIAEGCPPFLAVFPDTMTRLVGSQYLDSPGIGQYATYVMDEILPFVAERYRVGRWGALGRSSGGYGAITLAMTHPRKLSAVAANAPDMGFDLCYLGDLPPALSGVRRAGGLDKVVDAFWQSNRPGRDLFAALNLICMACAYSPDPDASPIPARLPLDFETGAVDFDVLASWREHDPIVRVRDHAQALRDLDLLYLQAGDRDEYNLHLGLRRFVAVLGDLEVPHEHEEFPGGHRGTSYRYDTSVPKLVAAISRPGRGG